MYAIVEYDEDKVYGVHIRTRRDSAINLGIKIFKEQYEGIGYTEEEIERKLECVRADLEVLGVAYYVGSYGIAVMSVSKD